MDLDGKTDLELVVDEQEVLTESEPSSVHLRKRPATALRTRTKTTLQNNQLDATGNLASFSAKKLMKTGSCAKLVQENLMAEFDRKKSYRMSVLNRLIVSSSKKLGDQTAT